MNETERRMDILKLRLQLRLDGFDPEAALEVALQKFSPLKDRLLAELRRTDMPNEFAYLKKTVEVKNGHLLSMPRLCVEFLRNWFEKSFEDRTFHFLHTGDIENFIIHYDFYQGFRCTRSSIIVAEEEILRGVDADIIKVITETENLTTAHSIDRFLQEKEEIHIFIELLKRDPTGLATLKEAVKSVETQSIFVKEFAVPGAKFAVTLYKTIYPQADI